MPNNITKQRSSDDWLTPLQVDEQYSQIYKLRTLEKWRQIHKESGDEIGPKWRRFGIRVIKYKRLWIERDIQGFGWIKEPSPQLHAKSATVLSYSKKPIQQQ